MNAVLVIGSTAAAVCWRQQGPGLASLGQPVYAVVLCCCADMWKSVVNSINLSEQQKLNIVQWKQLFMQKVSSCRLCHRKLSTNPL